MSFTATQPVPAKAGNHPCHRYLPLYVFCGDHLLAAYLRNSRIDGAKNATALIKTLVKGIRAHWPDTRILVRGDSGFCRQRLLRWCEKSGVRCLLFVSSVWPGTSDCSAKWRWSNAR